MGQTEEVTMAENRTESKLMRPSYYHLLKWQPFFYMVLMLQQPSVLPYQQSSKTTAHSREMDVLHKGWWDNNKYFINISVVRVTAVSLWPDYSITPTTCLSLKTYPRCPLQKVSFIEGRSNCPVPALSLHTSFNKTRG